MHTALHLYHCARHRAALRSDTHISARSHTTGRSLYPATNRPRSGDHLGQLSSGGSTSLYIKCLEQHLQTGLPHRLPPPPLTVGILLRRQCGLHLVQPGQLSSLSLRAPPPQQPGDRLPNRQPRIRPRSLHHGHPTSRS